MSVDADVYLSHSSLRRPGLQRYSMLTMKSNKKQHPHNNSNNNDNLGPALRNPSVHTLTNSQPRFAQTAQPSTLLQCRGFAREFPSTLIPSHSSLRPPSLQRYYNAMAQVRSGLEDVDATMMVGFRSGNSVDAVPKQRFAPAWKPSTLLRASLQECCRHYSNLRSELGSDRYQ